MSTFWFECLECGKGNHIKVIKNRVEIIEIIGAPGPNTETLQSVYCEGLDVRQDPAFLHIWFQDQHRDIPARK